MTAVSAPTGNTPQALPRLLDRRQIAKELGVTLAGAETIMRGCEKVHVGRRIYVTEPELRAYLKRAASR